MIDVLSTVQVTLNEAGFITHLTIVDQNSIVCFEDDILTGFCCIFENPEMLLASWKSLQMSLLMRYAPNLRAAGEKAWNVYCVFLCRSAVSPDHRRQVRWIEEDLERTRKITGCGLASREDVVRCLLPVLPIQHQPLIRAEDVTQRLRTRIQSIVPKASEIVLDESIAPVEVVRLLGETR
jgi:hypothetical protein